ncbi:DNA polymerase III subunit gamma/tau [Paraurantiacibacter namhicola]|uniref:DNA polymerase III subunit gamma/tau n=1 Tax=Paraurantiacibacter namhicola TaxID=645517 RepID=A0A1C7D9Y5_9SPHN|nr:DNA polymerase III subunit gamma/tau [Paraurantiacibacter namhicola]ANU08274.1 DNA polymerase III subunit tau [Paraurantiacibacter namhicola]
MGDSPDNTDGLPWATEPDEEAKPSAAELEAAGQDSMFGEPQPAAAPAPEPTPEAEPAPAEQAEARQPAAAAPQPQVTSKPAPKPDAAQPYRVLARKYRPQTFSELIGQDAMVRTLGNAIERDRLAHAFLMTGVRGVGKTSTARLIAKALNCVGPDGQGGPTIDPCGQCEPCTAIAEGRHIDVIEMDAASHTGVDDMRDIIEAVRYASVSARYKIYIIDEVHMLSRNAFNAMLKTLEEPPAHVKFLFATTEVDKLPVTVLSRTQRFDLRRIPADMLQQHFASICRQEDVEAEDEALAMIAAAAEGSVRDGLSILDQAIAHADMEGGGKVTAEKVRDMLGLADKGAQRRLFACLLEGDPQGLLAEVDKQYALGVEPLALLRAAMELAHRIALTQVGGGESDAPTLEERKDIEGWAGQLTAAQVHRLWQLLLKGYDEVKGAPDPLVSAQMALLRVLHASDMPDPGSLVKKLEELAANAPAPGAAGAAPAGGSAPAAALDWAQLVATVRDSGVNGAMSLASMLEMQVRVVELAPGRLVYAQPHGFDDDILKPVREGLKAATGQPWTVEKSSAEGSPTLVEQADAARQAEADRLRNDPMVKAAFAAFPDAELIEDNAPAAAAGQGWSRRA